MSDDQSKLLEKNTEAVNRLADEIARQNDLLQDQNHFLEVLKNVAVPAKQVTKALGLNKNTINQNTKITKFQPPDKNTNFILLGEIPLIQNNKTKEGKKRIRRK